MRIMITKDQIEAKAVKPEASRYAATIQAYTGGLNFQEILTEINGYENKQQHKLRKKLAISTEYITEDLLRPFDNIWNAKGGMTHIGAPRSKKAEIISQLQNVDGTNSLRRFMKDKWFNAFINDPNAIIYWDTAEKESPQLKIISSGEIKAIEYSGTAILWAIIKTDQTVETSDGEKTVWLYFDADVFQTVIFDNEGNPAVLEETQNTTKTIPAVAVSTIWDNQLGHFISPIHKQLGLLQSYLIKNSIKEIYQFLHLYPIFWQQETVCPVCNGRRTVDGHTCPACNGTGWALKKDVSDVFLIKRPDDENSNAIPPAGYVQPDLATMQEQRNELGWVFEQMFRSLWGTTVEKSKNETATGRFIDIQPVNNKLDWAAGIAEQIETAVANIIGRWVLPATFKTAIITYGRRFVIENPDAILKRYTEARQSNAPVKVLDMLLEQFYTAEYQNDPQMAEYYTKLMRVEPYPHFTQQDVENMPIPETTKNEKRAFPLWVNSKLAEEIIATPEDKLKLSLTKFAEQWQQKFMRATK